MEDSIEARISSEGAAPKGKSFLSLELLDSIHLSAQGTFMAAFPLKKLSNNYTQEKEHD